MMYMYIGAAVLMGGLGWLAMKSRQIDTDKDKLKKSRAAARVRFNKPVASAEDFLKAPAPRKLPKFGQVGR